MGEKGRNWIQLRIYQQTKKSYSHSLTSRCHSPFTHFKGTNERERERERKRAREQRARERMLMTCADDHRFTDYSAKELLLLHVSFCSCYTLFFVQLFITVSFSLPLSLFTIVAWKRMKNILSCKICPRTCSISFAIQIE